jgi:hypothetical protein
MQDLRLGLVALARTTFDIPLANQGAAQARLQLHDAGFQLAGSEGLITNLEGARLRAAMADRRKQLAT